jgi:hypothetical protein
MAGAKPSLNLFLSSPFTITRVAFRLIISQSGMSSIETTLVFLRRKIILGALYHGQQQRFRRTLLPVVLPWDL